MATLTNKNGTNGADIIDLTANGTYHANGGNDTINIKGGSIVVYTDSGNNIVNVTDGSGHTVKVAADEAASNKINGIETLTVNGADIVDAILGSGKDVIVLSNTNGKKANGALSQIRAGVWGDTFTVNNGAKNYQLYGDAGDDTFNITGGDNIIFWGGAANDTYNVTGGTNHKLRGGDSADTYNISVAGVDMQLGYGNDTVNVTAGDSQRIKANLGINTINLKAGNGHVITPDIDQTASKKAGKDVGYGVDKVYITGTVNGVTANLGDGKDVVEVSTGMGHLINTEGWGDTITVSGSVEYSYFYAGDGDDTINIQKGDTNYFFGEGGNDIITISGGDYNTVETGDGDNSIYVTGAADSYNIYAEAGDDELVVSAAITNSKINLVAGNNKITLAADNVSNNNTFTTGDGNDTVICNGGLDGNEYHLGSGKDSLTIAGTADGTFYTESGSDTITINTTGGPDVYTGYGADTINIVKVKNCYVNAEVGNDKFVITDVKDSVLIGGIGSDTFEGDSISNSTIYGDLITGTSTVSDDTITIASVSDTKIYAGSGADTITLGVKNKTRSYGSNDTIYGEAGKDTINVYHLNNVTTYGGDDDDEIYYVGCKDQKIYGNAGADTILIRVDVYEYQDTSTHSTYLKNEEPKVSGGAGDDSIYLTDITQALVFGGSGDDVISVSNNIWSSQGLAVNSQFYGGLGNDKFTVTLEDSARTDKLCLIGGSGNNTYNVSLLGSGIGYIDASFGKSGSYANNRDTLNLSFVSKVKASNIKREYYNYDSQDLMVISFSSNKLYIKGWSKLSSVTYKTVDDTTVTGMSSIVNKTSGYDALKTTLDSFSMKNMYGQSYLETYVDPFVNKDSDLKISGNSYK